MAETAREQKAFTWKAGYREAVEPKFEAWAETAPEGKKAFQDYILYLQTKADTVGSQGELDARIAALGIAPLVDMHKRRAEADARMLEQIADMLEDAKDKAMAEVQTELAALQKVADTATATAADLLAQKKALEKQLAETANALEAARVKAATMASQLDMAKTEAESALLKLDKTENKAATIAAALDEARAQLNAVRESSNHEKEKTLALAAEKDRLALTLEKTRQELEAKKRRSEDLNKYVQELAQKTAELKAMENALTEMKIMAASHEAQAKAQAQTIAALQMALAAATRDSGERKKAPGPKLIQNQKTNEAPKNENSN